MDASTSTLFDAIFQEAHVWDFDFSEWDRRLRLVVRAGLVPENFEADAGPLHVVDFVRVSSLEWSARHLGVELQPPERHFQWVVIESKVTKRTTKSGAGVRVTLTGVGPCPRLVVECVDLEISVMDPAIVDRVNSGWERPSAPLARPGLHVLGGRGPRPRGR